MGVDTSSASADPARAPWRIDRHELPGAGYPAQLDAAAVLEPGARADDQVTDGARDEDFAGAGLAEIRAAMWTASPPMSSPRSSHSPVWMAGADLDTQCFGVSAHGLGAADGLRRAVECDEVAVAGVLTTVPPNRRVSSTVISRKRCSTARHRSSPAAAANCVEATMSVNNTVRRARCACAGAAWLPVRNSSISVRILSGSLNQGRWSAPSTSRYRAPGMWSAKIAAQLHRHDAVLAGMDDQGWHGDRRQDRPYVDPERRFE